MTLEPLLAAPLVVQVHACAAIFCLLPTACIFALPKGTGLHMAAGVFFVVLMLTTAASSFWITDIIPGRFSPIHLLSLQVLYGVPTALWRLRQGNIRGHRQMMIGMSIGLLAAGAFTLMPGRIMSAVVFGP